MDANVSLGSVHISVHGYKRLTEKRVAVFMDKTVSLRSVLQC